MAIEKIQIKLNHFEAQALIASMAKVLHPELLTALKANRGFQLQALTLMELRTRIAKKLVEGNQDFKIKASRTEALSFVLLIDKLVAGDQFAQQAVQKVFSHFHQHTS